MNTVRTETDSTNLQKMCESINVNEEYFESVKRQHGRSVVDFFSKIKCELEHKISSTPKISPIITRPRKQRLEKYKVYRSDGVVFDTCVAAAKASGVSEGAVRMAMLINSTTRSGFRFNKTGVFGPAKRRFRYIPIKVIETGMIFNNYNEASIYLGANVEAIRGAIARNYKLGTKFGKLSVCLAHELLKTNEYKDHRTS